MIITHQTLQALRTMVRGEFATQMADLLAKGAYYQQLATTIQSNTRSNTYGWLGDFPHLREWVGDRAIKDMKETAYAIINKKYESTLGVDRVDLEDDNLGVYRTRAQAEANAVISFFEQSIAALMKDGFSGLCFDGQPFFDTDHPVYPNTDGTGAAESVSNIVGSGNGKPWFLLSLDGVLKPFILQERSAPEMDEITDIKNEYVFMKDKYLFGVRYRGNFGYGFWQQAVASKEELTAANYEAARLKMQTFKRDGGDPMGIRPTHLVVDPTNESKARAILETQLIGGGNSNPNFHTAELIVSPWL
ncbi:MAG: Mu-like prophage major head subunit gpT family protein [Treponema sp.]|jgi:phage major head subunit gpT-like protein|nr:Mu-like prophage major head subunit gpT family protein [Treponema sp.]